MDKTLKTHIHTLHYVLALFWSSWSTITSVVTRAMFISGLVFASSSEVGTPPQLFSERL